MKRPLVFVGVLVVGILTAGLAGPAMADTAKVYSSCDKLLAAFPHGVAKNAAAATKAVATGSERPATNAAVYKKNSGRLDRDKDGVMCEQTAALTPAAIPSPTPAPTRSSVYWIPLHITLADAWMQTQIQAKGINQAQSNYMWAVGSTFQKNPFTYCPVFKAEPGRSTLMNSLTTTSLANSGLDGSYIPWVNEQAPLIIGIVCASFGL